MRGRADSIIESSAIVAQTTGRVSKQLNKQDRGVINALVGGLNVSGEPSQCTALYLFCQASVIVLIPGAHGAGDYTESSSFLNSFD